MHLCLTGLYSGKCSDLTRIGALPEEVFIHTAEMTAKVALKEIHRRENKTWVIYKNSQRSMQSIEYKKENRAILNQIYVILEELQEQDDNMTLCKILAQMEIKRKKRSR